MDGREGREDWQHVAHTFRNRIAHIAVRLDKSLGLTEKYDILRQYAVEHPLVAIAALITVVICSFPVMFFVGFVFISLFFTFMGFLFFEGLLVSFGALVLCFLLCCAGVLSVLISSVLIGLWLAFHYGHVVVSKAWEMVRGYGEHVHEE